MTDNRVMSKVILFTIYCLQTYLALILFFRGTEFRKDFSELSALRSYFPDIPFMALTATASLASINIIKSSLNMVKCKVVRANPDRKNIFLVKKITNNFQK